VALIGTVAMVTGILGIAGSGRAAADTDPFKGTVTGLACPDPHKCSGFLAGSDGTALDTDLVLPSASRYPLLVLVHGWSGSKGDGSPILGYPGDQFFTDRGYAVLRYSTRGFGKSWGQVSFAAPDREIADLRALVSTVVDDARFSVQADKIGVTGQSYGGGHSWLVAMQPTWTTPAGKPVRLAAVAPVATWTDLGQSLLPNGREDSTTPVGTPKLSFLTGLFGVGLRHDIERPYPNYSPDLGLYFGRAIAGEPYQLGSAQDPLVAGLVNYLKVRSVDAYPDWLDRLRNDPSSRVPILVAQGWADDLFPSIEALRMVRALRGVSPDYPVKLYLGDIGHPRAANKPAEVDWVTTMVVKWFDYWLKGQGPKPTFDVTAATTTPGAFDPSQIVTAPAFEGLSSGVVSTSFGGPFLLVSQPVQTGGLPADPITPPVPVLGDLFRTLPLPTEGIGGISPQIRVDDLAGGRPVQYEGRGTVHLTGTVIGGDAQYDVRLWDRDDHGTSVLVDRGTAKFVGVPGRIQIDVPLDGNAWKFLPGHTLALDVTNVDLPYLRPDNLPSSTLLDKVALDLPVRGASAASQANSLLGLRIGSAANGNTPAGGVAQTLPAPDAAENPFAVGHPTLVTAKAAADQVRAAGDATEVPHGTDARSPWLAVLLASPFLLAIALAALRSRARTASQGA
jgi:predicted acyl esterase